MKYLLIPTECDSGYSQPANPRQNPVFEIMAYNNEIIE